MTRGERNNNPLNIRRSAGTHWLGEAARQRDREFVQFRCLLFGLRAAFRVMRSYLTVHGLCTLRQVIYRWAPPEDGNATETYVAVVSERSGVRAGELLEWTDEARLVAVVRAMAWVESHMDGLDDELLRQAYQLAK